MNNIQPQELKLTDIRFGNYVQMLGETSRFRFQDLDFHLNRKAGVLLSVYPIKLTEQWLLDFGFEKWTWCDDCAFIPLFFGDSLYCRYFDNKWHIKKMKVGRDSKGVFGKSDSKYIIPKGKLKYVHQLQNLYYALTQTELKKS